MTTPANENSASTRKPEQSDPRVLIGKKLMHQRRDLCELLTDAQLRVLEGLLGGMSMPEISKMSGRSTHTVHDHTKAIYQRLKVSSRVQLVLLFSHSV